MTLLLKFQFLVSGTMCHKSLPMKIRTFFLETCDVFQDIFSGNMRCVSCSTVLGSKVIEVKHVAFEPFEFSGKYTKKCQIICRDPAWVCFFFLSSDTGEKYYKMSCFRNHRYLQVRESTISGWSLSAAGHKCRIALQFWQFEGATLGYLCDLGASYFQTAQFMYGILCYI